MKKILETIVFFGNERLATGVQTSAPTLRALVEAGFTVAAVVANETPSKSRRNRELEVGLVAKEFGIPLLLPHSLKEIMSELDATKAIAGVLVAYGKIVPESVISLFPRGIINIHPSLLPLHRGPTPIESVILEGTRQTGVSIMQLIKAMDAGPVYAQKKVLLQGAETKQELADALLTVGSELLIDCLPDILSGNLMPNPQIDSHATYDRLLTKEDGYIDWSKSALQIEREIRAFQGWPKSRAIIGGKEVVVIEAKVTIGAGTPGKVYRDGKKLLAYTGNGSLEITKLKPADKQEMSAEAFLAGYGQLFKGS